LVIDNQYLPELEFEVSHREFNCEHICDDRGVRDRDRDHEHDHDYDHDDEHHVKRDYEHRDHGCVDHVSAYFQQI